MYHCPRHRCPATSAPQLDGAGAPKLPFRPCAPCRAFSGLEPSNPGREDRVTPLGIGAVCACSQTGEHGLIAQARTPRHAHTHTHTHRRTHLPPFPPFKSRACSHTGRRNHRRTGTRMHMHTFTTSAHTPTHEATHNARNPITLLGAGVHLRARSSRVDIPPLPNFRSCSSSSFDVVG
jgi:hypothetical protein